MVGPISESERTAFATRVKAVIVLVVGVSAGLMAFQGGAPLPLLVGAVLAGLVVGVVLVWIVFPGSGGRSPR